jgi:hypothetical protein
VNDPLSIAKGSVLLAEQCSSSNNHAGCLWLDIALHHARLIGAHNCDGELNLRALDALCKKRLWWCILIRDMVLAIGLRIPAKINRIHFNLSSPAMDDLKEYTRVLSSRSFSAQIKHALSQIFGLQCRLAIITSEISTLAYGPTAEILSVGLQGSCILFCILTPNYDRLAHRRLFSLTRLLFSYLSLTRALFSLLRIYLRILGSLSLGNYRSRAP